MPPYSTADHPPLEIIIRSPGTVFDEVVLQCPNLTWNQVFTAIDRLSRQGALTLAPNGQGLYSIHVSDQPPQNAQSVSAALN